MGLSPNLVFGKENEGWDKCVPLVELSETRGTKLTHQNTWVTFVLPSFHAFNLPLTRSPLLFDLKPFLTSKTFEAITTSTPATVKANPNSAAGETHFNQIVSPKPAFSPNSVKRHRLVRRIDRRAPIWNPHPFYRRQESSLESQPKRRPENWVLCLICHSFQHFSNRPSLPTPKFQHFISFSLAFPQSLIAHSSTVLIPKASDQI
ncbi:hypothetical protein FEM48_Zijuj07G0171100 [Ziziphus jujuba var. spinosa]|uniref:Uncharacterized protein n=1 Tax=Ziziphus jujuba var. spinosa TaxID=714518 RepID=A0A978V5W2_ZIZJJ|nr:hypothetical protein FEM48_Zijuj07G0171100 [Ziziphus jujuba var. spinosa]